MENKYKIIYADPPWEYSPVDSWKKMGGGVGGKYSMMNVWQICALPVKALAAPNCILFLWATFPNLKEAIMVMEAWGFKYTTLGFSWIKTNKENGKPFFGIGHYTKSNCEVCLIGTKGGSMKVSDMVSSVVISPKREHSRKPDEVRERIVELCGDRPRIELFARERFDGWDVWGNEAPAETQMKIFTGRTSDEPSEVSGKAESVAKESSILSPPFK